MKGRGGEGHLNDRVGLEDSAGWTRGQGGPEVGEFGVEGRRSGVPCVVVISPTGEELAFLQSERFGAAALKEWEPQTQSAWPIKGEL